MQSIEQFFTIENVLIWATTRALDKDGKLPRRGQHLSGPGEDMARRRFQSGSLMLRRNSWVARYREDIQLEDGRVRRVRKSLVIGTRAELPTQKLAQRRLQSLLARINSAGYRPGRVASLQEFVERWRSEVLSQRKPSTAMAAEGHLKKHILPQLGSLRLDELTVERQQRFVSHLSGHMSRKTLLNVLGTLSSILGTAAAWGYLSESVSRKKLALPSRTGKPHRPFFTAEEIRRIVAAASEPYATLYLLAAVTGMREGELFGLKLSDLDFDRKLIHVCRSVWRGRIQTPKSESSTRVLPMPGLLAARLKQYLKTWRPNSVGLLFASRKGAPLNPNHVVFRKLYPLLDALKIERGGLHAFRHSHSTLLLEGGAPLTVAQAQLGHSDLMTTANVYSHLMPNSQRDAVERLAGVLDSNGLTAASKVN
jgi:integrase